MDIRWSDSVKTEEVWQNQGVEEYATYNKKKEH